MASSKIKALGHLLSLFLPMVPRRTVPSNYQWKYSFRIRSFVLWFRARIGITDGLDTSFRRAIIRLRLRRGIPLRPAHSSESAAHLPDPRTRPQTKASVSDIPRVGISNNAGSRSTISTSCARLLHMPVSWMASAAAPINNSRNLATVSGSAQVTPMLTRSRRPYPLYLWRTGFAHASRRHVGPDQLGREGGYHGALRRAQGVSSAGIR